MLKVVWQDASRNCGKGESILIVDDSPEQRALAKRMMQRLGYEVFTAASGEEAVSLVNKRQYDLLILDMIMPPGMDGFWHTCHMLYQSLNKA
jgi:two-component system cell cycle sensor histidine kinase/response regulator CckA